MAEAAVPNDTVQPELADLTILHVDDTEAALVLMRSILGAAGYRNVHSLADSRKVRSEFSRLRPDLLILDLHMPERSGFEVLADLRDLLGTAFPVLIVTSDVRTSMREEALRQGACDFLTKPYSAAEIRLRIANMLKMRHLQKQLSRHNE
ncbi:MAG TPA: response regulator, partial [Deinococcales bacterium]|nr:response regulator [Deinococcales bacterium]